MKFGFSRIFTNTLIGCTSALMISTTCAIAGPVADFDKAFADVYAAYRVALFTTNTGDGEKSKKALGQFTEKWTAMTGEYSKSPPPQYQDDGLWSETLSAIANQLEKANAEVGNGELPAAHLALEGIREEVGALHARNGVEQFSDRMNAYHAEMEHVLDMDMAAIDETSARTLLERAAVMSYLAKDILQFPPSGTSPQDTDYAALSSAFSASVDQFLSAARDGNPENMKKAVAGLKVPYSKFFLKYG
jgi:soluble cytochrome b562